MFLAVPLFVLSLALLFTTSDAMACNIYPAGEPRVNGVPRCPCGYYWADNGGGTMSDCGSAYTGTPKCISVSNAPPNGITYHQCSTHPRCCCPNGACCRNNGMYEPSGTACLSPRYPCEGTRRCTGNSPGCPAGPYKTGSVCRQSRGPCEKDGVCQSGNYQCPSSFRSTNYVCRDPPAGGVCQNPTTCTGSSYRCPDIDYKSSSTKCRNAQTICERNSYCTGSNAYCPGVLYQPANTLCRASRGRCESDAYCSGSSSACPSTFHPSSEVCQPSRGPCESPAFCSGSSAGCPSKFLPSSIKCANSTGPCESDRFCTGSSQFCPTAYKATGTQCSVGSDPCEDGASFCAGNTANCPFVLKDNSTICGVNPYCPVIENRCSGSSTKCLNAPCPCPPGKYGEDCSCSKPAPAFLGEGATCLQNIWYSQDGTLVINSEEITVDGTVVIRGDYQQPYGGTLILNGGSFLNVTGCAAISGRIVVDLSGAQDVSSGAADVEVAYGCKVTGSELLGVDVVGYVAPDCKVLNYTTNEVLPPGAGGTDSSSTTASPGVSILFNLVDDPVCSQRAVMTATVTASAGVGLAIAVVSVVLVVRRRRRDVMKREQKRKMDAVSDAINHGDSARGGTWESFNVGRTTGDFYAPEVSVGGAATADGPRAVPPMPSHSRNSMPVPRGWHRSSVPTQLANADPNAAVHSHPRSRPLPAPPSVAGAAGAAVLVEGDNYQRQRAASRAAKARPLPTPPVAGASLAAIAAAGGRPPPQYRPPNPNGSHRGGHHPRPHGPHRGGHPRPNGAPPHQPRSPRARPLPQPPGAPGGPGDQNRQRAGSRAAKNRPLPTPPADQSRQRSASRAAKSRPLPAPPVTAAAAPTQPADTTSPPRQRSASKAAKARPLPTPPQ